MTTEAPRLIYRHRALVRICHWINVVCLTVLLMSGLQIFNAHSALYWGKQSDWAHPVLAMTAEQGEGGRAVGTTTILGHTFTTTGLLGVSDDAAGRATERGFPRWATLPADQSLALGRRWHFFFAWLFVLNGAVYLLYSLFGGHLRRDLLPSGQEAAGIGRSIRDHLRFRFPHGAEARHYNVLQKLSYLVVVLVLAPVMVLAGLAMSPRLDAGFPFLLDLFGGRQSARTIHFVIAAALVLFALVHVVMVLISGVLNNLRSMITGWYDIGHER